MASDDGAAPRLADEAAMAPPQDDEATVAMAQVVHFCNVFRSVLKLPLFGRTELEAAVKAGGDGDARQRELLAEVHFKLIREHPTVKMERMLQEWERAVLRKAAEIWPMLLASNPLDYGATYAEWSVALRIQVLNALCHWKLESCPELHKHIGAMQKEDEAKAMEQVRATPIGFDDAGAVYWYLNDGCWVYAEDPRHPQHGTAQYAVEFADAKRIRLSINFDVDTTKQDVKVFPTDTCPSNSKMDLRLLVNQTSTDGEEVVCDIKNENGGVKAEVVSNEVMLDTSQEVSIKSEIVKCERGKIDIQMLCDSPASSIEDVKFSTKHDSVMEPMADNTGNVQLRMDKDVSNEDSVKHNGQPISYHENGQVPAEPNHVKQEQNSVNVLTDKQSQLESPSAAVDTKKRLIIDDDNSSDDCPDRTNHSVTATTKDPSPVKKKPRVSEPASSFEHEMKTNSEDPVRDGLSSTLTKPSNGAGGVPFGVENATDRFDVECEACKRSYDMRYLDPPLIERPVGEWRCFECLVNDARGWPRRRKSPSMKVDTDADNHKVTEEKSSRKKTPTKSSKRGRKNSSARSSSSKTSRSRSRSRHTHSSNKNSKTSSSSRRKKRKSSSSARHHGRHRHQHHVEEYASLLSTFRDRQQKAVTLRNTRLHGDYIPPENVSGPSNWRTVCSTVEGLSELTKSLTGGSLEQDRLRGRLISILKTQEKMEVERLKTEEILRQTLPTRQSSRIAMGRIKDQASLDILDNDDDDEDSEPQRSHRRTGASLANGVVGYDSKDRLALERDSRARRRHQMINSDDEESEDEEPNHALSIVGWIDWSTVLDGKPLSLVCNAIVQRLLQETISELFARPVQPDEDGCPDYLSVIKNPMDLGTVRDRVGSGFYEGWEDFTLDVARVWKNCRTYNGSDTMIVDYANTLEKMFKAMCKAAEHRGVKKWTDASKVTQDDVEKDDRNDLNSSDSSDVDSRGSVTKEWSQNESSASESSSDDSGEAMSDDANVRVTRQTRSTRSSRSTKSTRSTRSRRRTRSSSSSSEESMDSDSSADADPPARHPRSRRQSTRDPATKTKAVASAPTPAVKPNTRRRRRQISESSSSESSADDDSSESDAADDPVPEEKTKEQEPDVPPPPSPHSPRSPPPPPPSPGPVSAPRPALSSSSYFSSSDSESSASEEDSSDSSD